MQALKAAREAFSLARQYDLVGHAASALEQIASLSILETEVRADGAQTRYSRAARILGFVNARLAALGSVRLPFAQPQYELVAAILREALGTSAVDGLLASGTTLTDEQAATFATSG